MYFRRFINLFVMIFVLYATSTSSAYISQTRNVRLQAMCTVRKIDECTPRQICISIDENVILIQMLQTHKFSMRYVQRRRSL